MVARGRRRSCETKSLQRGRGSLNGCARPMPAFRFYCGDAPVWMHDAWLPVRQFAASCGDPIKPIPLRTVVGSNVSDRARPHRGRVTPPCRRGPYRRCCSLAAGWVSWSADATRPVRIQVSDRSRDGCPREVKKLRGESASTVDADLTRLHDVEWLCATNAGVSVLLRRRARVDARRLPASSRVCRVVRRSDQTSPPANGRRFERQRSSSTTPRSGDATLPSRPISAVLFAHGRMGFLVSGRNAPGADPGFTDLGMAARGR